MSFTEIEPGSKLTIELLDSIKSESWAQSLSWTRFTKLKIVDEQDRATLTQAFSSADLFTFDDRQVVKKYIIWKKQTASQTPENMAIDKAVADGHEVTYTPTQAVINSTNPMIVPASRVPLETSLLRKSAEGAPSVRMGSDVMAASIASMTRWTGVATVVSMPVDTIAKFQFTYAQPDGIQTLLILLPPGPSNSGLRGRSWAYYLAHHFQNMEAAAYGTLMTAWCRAIFGLRKPTIDTVIEDPFKENIGLYTYKGNVYYKIMYKSPAELGSFENGFEWSESYEQMAAQVVSLAAARQGDGAGIAMLSQSVASWGLVSHSQSILEQTVSLIVGMAHEKTILSGYTQVELGRIRASVKKWNPRVLVLEKVESHVRTRSDQTVTTSGGLHLIRQRTSLDTTLTVTRTGKVKQYNLDEALVKLWEPVEYAVREPNAVVLMAGLPPLGTKIKIFVAGNTWASVFFFSQMEQLKRAVWDHEKGLIIKPHVAIDPKAAQQAIIRGMNNTLATWVVPPINRNVSFSSLLCPITLSGKRKVCFSPDEDDYTVDYLDEDEIEVVDPMEEVASVPIDPDALQKPKKRPEKPAAPTESKRPPAKKVEIFEEDN